MFRKPFAVSQTHKVSGADRKKIRRSVEKAFALPPDSPLLDALLPPKAGDLEVAKLAAPSRVVIYLLDGVPVLLDPSGRGQEFVPTVMGLWRCCGLDNCSSDGGGGAAAAAASAEAMEQQQQAPLLPVLTVKHWQVSQFIVGGADVMLPGVDAASLPPSFNKGALFAVAVPGNPCPIAVGVAAMNGQTAHSQAVGGKGKLLEVLQHYGDCLWASLGGAAAPNHGFQQGCVLPLHPDPQELAAEGVSSEAGAAGSGGAAPAAAAQGVAQLSLAGAAAANADALQQQQQQQEQQQQQQASTTPAEMDGLLEAALLQALVKSVKDVPLNSSTLWSQHVLPCRPAGSTLDVKRSSHKKMSKFLQVYSKQGLIVTREDKHSGDTLLTGVNRRHQLLADFVPHKAAGSGGSSGSSSSAAAAGSGSGSGQGQQQGPGGGGAAAVPVPLVVEEVWKPNKELKGIFEAVGADPSGLFTAAEAGEVAFAYARQQQLDARGPDAHTLLLDATLCDALFTGVLKKGELFPTHIAKAELRAAFLRRCSSVTQLTRGRQQVVRKGSPPAIHISAERRQGNKMVTRVTGVEAFLIDPAAFAAECQRVFAASTTLAELPGKSSGGGHEVIIQGNWVAKLQLPDHLMRAHGIPKHYLFVKQLK